MDLIYELERLRFMVRSIEKRIGNVDRKEWVLRMHPDYERQCDRIRHLASELNPRWTIDFDSGWRHKTYIEFTIEDQETGKVLGSSSGGTYSVTQIADMSDEELRQLILQISEGKTSK